MLRKAGEEKRLNQPNEKKLKIEGKGFLHTGKETSGRSCFKAYLFKKRLWFQLSSLVYLTFLIASLMVSPTTAHFTSSETIAGKIVADVGVDEEEQDEPNDDDVNSEEQEDMDSSKNEENEPAEDESKQAQPDKQDESEEAAETGDKEEVADDEEDADSEETDETVEETDNEGEEADEQK